MHELTCHHLSWHCSAPCPGFSPEGFTAHCYWGAAEGPGCSAGHSHHCDDHLFSGHQCIEHQPKLTQTASSKTYLLFKQKVTHEDNTVTATCILHTTPVPSSKGMAFFVCLFVKFRDEERQSEVYDSSKT